MGGQKEGFLSLGESITHPKVVKGEWDTPYDSTGWDVPPSAFSGPLVPIMANMPSYFKQDWNLEAVRAARGLSHSNYRVGEQVQFVFHNPIDPPTFSVGFLRRSNHLDFSQIVKPTVDFRDYSNGKAVFRRCADFRLATTEVVGPNDLANLERLRVIRTGLFLEDARLDPFLFTRVRRDPDWTEIVAEDPTRFIMSLNFYDAQMVLLDHYRRILDADIETIRKLTDNRAELEQRIADLTSGIAGLEQRVASFEVNKDTALSIVGKLPKPRLFED